jgi:hypothetical protein
MAEVSVRFAVADDTEIVLNLAVPQALRLVQALAGRTADVVATQVAGREQPPTGATRLPTWPAPPS